MSQVELTTLGKSCKFFNGKAHEKSIDENGKYIVVNSKFISSEGKSFKRTNEQMFPLYKGDIVMVMSDVPNGKALAKCFIIDKDDTYSLNQRICCIRSKEFDTKYLYYHLNRHEHFLAFNNGENQTNLRKDDILACPLIKPSIEEQKRVTEIIDISFEKLDSAKDRICKNIINSDLLYINGLQRVFNNYDTDWNESVLGNLCKIQLGKTPARKSSKMWDEKKITNNIWLSIADMVHGEIISDSYEYVSDIAAKEMNLIPKGTLLLSFKLTLGRVSFAGVDLYTNEAIAALLDLSNKIDKKYLYYYFSAFDWISYSEGDIKVKGRTLNKEKLKVLPIRFPDLEKQKELVQYLDELKYNSEKVKSNYQTKSLAIDELKSGILNKAFENKLIEAK